MHLSRLFQRSVRMHATRPALASGDSPAITYAELDLRVRALARWFSEDLGLVPGDRVVIALKNCTAYAEAMLAIWHARLCAVPINSKLHSAEVAYILQDAEAALCIAQGALHDELAASTGKPAATRLLNLDGDAWPPASARPAPAAAQSDSWGADDELAWLFYTSGTTGKPKGVMLTHANLVAMALNFHADMLAIDSRDTLIHVAPMSHGGGLYGIPYWIQGGCQRVPASGGFDEAELFSLLRQQGRASFFASPTIVTRMVQHAASAAQDAALPGLRCIFAGGAPFYVEDIKAAVRCFGPRIAQMYGQGETPMTIAALRAETIAHAVEKADDELLGSVGFAQTTVDIDILDPQGLPLANGQAGEVAVRSPTVMRGYWRNDSATAATLVDGRLLTGDVGLVDARGLLHLKDRSKDVIISGGSNIYPREVEEALLLHAHVREVSVIGAKDAEWGESITAVVVASSPVTPAELDALCLRQIARFKRPKRYVFVDALPKNATGKVLKNELRRAYST